MKKLFVFLLCICLLLISAGCTEKTPTVSTDPSTTADTDAETTKTGKTVLDVYYLKTQFPTAEYIVRAFMLANPNVTVNITAFQDAEQMDLQIASELSAGKGPDMVFFTGATTLDTVKMAKNGAFLDLTPLMGTDPTYLEEEYFPVLDAGKVDSKQFLMPLRMRLPYLLTTQDRFSQELNLSEDYSASALMQSLTQAAAANAENYSTLHFKGSEFYGEGSLLHEQLRLGGIAVADLESQAQSVPDDIFLEYAAFTKMAYGQYMKTVQFFRQSSINTISGVLSVAAAVHTDRSLPCNLRYYAAILDQAMKKDIRLVTYPNYSDAAALTADIPLYAAIAKHTEEPEAAYALIRYGMDYSFNNINEDLPISRSGVNSLLTNISAYVGKTFQEGAVTVKVPRLTQEQKDFCLALFDRIRSGSIRNPAIGAIFSETMGDYITGASEFEECYQQFKNQLSIYLYE